MPKNATSLEEQLLTAYDEYADAIFRHCALRLRDRELGKDLMQDTFMRVWQSMQNGTEIENMRAFLYRIANNLIIDHVRRRKLRQEDSLETMREEQGFDLPDPTPGPARVTQGAMAMESLNKIDEPYRTTLLLRYVDGLPPREIATLLGVSSNVVSVRVHRGIEQLATILNPSDG